MTARWWKEQSNNELWSLLRQTARLSKYVLFAIHRLLTMGSSDSKESHKLRTQRDSDQEYPHVTIMRGASETDHLLRPQV